MGGYIRLEILPLEMEPVEWERVYEESLLLVGVYPFLDLLVDEETYKVLWSYVDRSRERPLRQAGNGLGWHVFGDEVSLQTGQSFELVRSLEMYRSRLPRGCGVKGTDVLAGLLEEEWLEPAAADAGGGVVVFDGKTQGHPYHLYVLAIACLIESRFPGKAVVTGDVAWEQMRSAVGWANAILHRKIEASERCDANRLLNRIRPLVRNEVSALEAWMRLSLVESEEERGAFMRGQFSTSVIRSYYLARFREHPVGMLGFRKVLQEYLLQGFPLAEACRICVLEPKGCQYDAEAFAEAVLQLGWPDGPEQKEHKRLSGLLEPRREIPETVYSMLGKVILTVAGVSEPLRTGYSYSGVVDLLKAELGERCDMEAVLERRAESLKAGRRNNLLEKMELIMDELELSPAQGYDINQVEGLMGWTWGDRIHPRIKEKLGQVSAYITGAGREVCREELERFQAGDQRKKEVMLVSRCRSFYIHKKAWDFILSLNNRPGQQELVYLLLSVKADEYSVHHICKALANNTELLRAFILKEELLH